MTGGPGAMPNGASGEPTTNGPGAPQPTRRSRDRSVGRIWASWGIPIVLVVLLAVAAIVDREFVSASNLTAMLRESAYVGIAAAGMTVALMSGTFDLSVGGQLALISVVSLMGYAAGGSILAVVAAVMAGLSCGLLNGLIITRLRVTPFVATLGTLFLFRGIAYALTADGPKKLPYSEIGSAYVQIGSADVLGVPVPFVLMLIVYGAIWLLLRRTITGRRIIAFGSSPVAARFCGISADRLRLFVFGVVGLTVGIAALTYVTRIWTADGGTQDGFELKVIAAAVLGGTSLRGGQGTLLGTFCAVLLLSGLNDFLVRQGVEASYQRIVLGVVLIAALAIDGLRTRSASGSPRRLSLRRRSEVMPAS